MEQLSETIDTTQETSVPDGMIRIDALYAAAFVGASVSAEPSEKPKGPSKSDLEALAMAQRNIGKYTGRLTANSAPISEL